MNHGNGFLAPRGSGSCTTFRDISGWKGLKLAQIGNVCAKEVLMSPLAWLCSALSRKRNTLPGLTQGRENESDSEFPVPGGAMAAAGDIQALWDEATCPICLDYFTDPVIIFGCGHNFCQACLTQFWRKAEDRDASCPQCRETVPDRSFVSNRQLANFVEITKKLNLKGQRRVKEAEGVCEKHQEPLKLFCKDHQIPICVVCDRSKEHKCHRVVPQEEAFQEYKDQICSRLEILRAEREKILMYKADSEKESQDLLNQTEDERQKTKAEFQQIHQFLEEQEKSLLAQIEELEKEVARRREEHLARLCRELSFLENLIQEIEEKSQQPASEFLQDIGKTLQRYEKKQEVLENHVAFPPELICRIKAFYDVKPLLERVMDQFPAAKVTLDPDTAHPQLILSEDRKSVRWEDKWQDLPNNPERFDDRFCVLGSEGFTSGKHFWEVTVGREECWIVGVARKSVRRKGRFALHPEQGIWAMGKWGGYRVFTSPDSARLTLRQELKRIRVTLNCAKRQVSFSDADSGVHLYTFSGATFSGETLLPFFSVISKAHLRLSLRSP